MPVEMKVPRNHTPYIKHEIPGKVNNIIKISISPTLIQSVDKSFLGESLVSKG